jgi:two-component system cell cycle sensor histidine kinase/response regulator CckA
VGPHGYAGRAVLVVDDEAAVLNLLRRLVESFGFVALSAETAMGGLELFRTHQQAVDLAILDLTLPDLGGSALAARLWSLRPDLRILFCSGHDETRLPPHLREDDRTGFIQKPYRKASLASCVAALTGQALPANAPID